VAARGFVGTTAAVGVASLARAGSPGRAFLEAGLAMQAGEPIVAASMGRFHRPRIAPEADGLQLSLDR
jgi:hypothetical protein